MNRIFKIFLLVVTVLIAPRAMAADVWRLAPEKSTLTFFVRTTLHDVHGKAQTMSGSFAGGASSAGAATAGAASAGAVDLAVAGLTTDNKGRDVNMYRMFNEPKYKDIHFAFGSPDLSALAAKGEGTILIPGTMTIHNITHPVTLTATGRLAGGTLTCEGAFDIHLKDYDLHPPTVLMMIRVADLVNVKYAMVFTRGDQ
ncbi:MAG: YceI family protein [Candidatus Omnitrophota bacterium]